MNIIGYSGHGYVVIETAQSMGVHAAGYFDKSEKELNPYHLKYLGSEKAETAIPFLTASPWFVSIGDNVIRAKIYQYIASITPQMSPNIIHPSAIISPTATLGHGVLIPAGVVINALAKIGNGVVCNTRCVIEHECHIGDFSFVSPGAVLCGNVKIGKGVFIGAGAVVIPGVTIGDNSIVGAGTIVLKNVAPNSKVIGNPAKIKYN
jgi:sugar O-acyltransferase (sialic acid O-acetyltransferase NeuD family)